jgi:hypothetical protein
MPAALNYDLQHPKKSLGRGFRRGKDVCKKRCGQIITKRPFLKWPFVSLPTTLNSVSKAIAVAAIVAIAHAPTGQA